MEFILFLILFISLVIAGILNWRRAINNNRRIKALQDENNRLNKNEPEDSRDRAYREAFSNKPKRVYDEHTLETYKEKQDREGSLYDSNGKRIR